MAGNTSTLSESGGRMSVALGGINELYLDGTNDPTTGQVLSAAGSNQFTWIDATGGGTDTNDYATAGTFTLTGGDLSLTDHEVPPGSRPSPFPSLRYRLRAVLVTTNDFVDTAAHDLCSTSRTQGAHGHTCRRGIRCADASRPIGGKYRDADQYVEQLDTRHSRHILLPRRKRYQRQPQPKADDPDPRRFHGGQHNAFRRQRCSQRRGCTEY